VKKTIKRVLNNLPYVKALYKENLNLKQNSCWFPGHFYSPVISIKDVENRQSEIWKNTQIEGIQGIDLQTMQQKYLIKSFAQYYKDLPFSVRNNMKNRYWFENDYYSYTDGIVLYSMIRHFEPKRIIEVGSGFSSAAMLDTNELFFNNKIELTFIEPYPERLNNLLTKNDKKLNRIIQNKLQAVSLDEFKKLEAGDILFVDSTHVVKTGSDVNYILFEILPVLQSGVLIHFHDVFYPFEYPKSWVLGGRNWNEDYFLRAFLMYNEHFKIRLFSHYLHELHKEVFVGMPLCYKNAGGNLWLEKN
jgi:predicted O-methyltransferase YrrM